MSIQEDHDKLGSYEMTEVLPSAIPLIDPEAERKLLRKIDFRLIPVVWTMFLFSNLDRSNIGNAYSGGMKKDLNMTSQQYSIALLVFFIGYCLGEIPSNMLLSRFRRPSIFLPALMFVWGGVAIALAGAQNYAQLAGVRVVLGWAEAGFSPGVIFFLSAWYRKNEMAKRFCIIWTGSPTSGAFGGILAGAIIKRMNGTAGLFGWQWLFIIEGIATCAAAVVAYFILPDFPATTKWLTPEEKEIALARLRADDLGSDDGTEQGHWKSLKACFTDWRTYVFMALYTMATGALTITYFIPVLVASLGYSGPSIQYMTVPIYGVCIVFILIVCFHSDRTGERAYHLAGCAAVSAICFAVIMGVTQPTVRYVMLCFAAAGIWCSVPLILVWVSNVISWPAEKRAIAQATTNAAGNLASIYGAFLWPSTDAPRYFAGFGATMSFLIICSALAIIGGKLFVRYPYPEMRPASRQMNA